MFNGLTLTEHWTWSANVKRKHVQIDNANGVRYNYGYNAKSRTIRA